MLYFSCCSQNNGVITEGSILRCWMVCALERLIQVETKKKISAEIAVKSTGFREMVDAWLPTHQLPQKLFCWQACLVVS